MTIEPEDLEEYEIINFFDDDYQEYWIEQIGRSDWEGALQLKNLLEKDELKNVLGEAARFYMLTDGESLISFCTLSEKTADISEEGPWLDFIYTKEEYRNNGCMKKLISFVEETVRDEGSTQLCAASNEELKGFFEACGFTAEENITDNKGISLLLNRKVFN